MPNTKQKRGLWPATDRAPQGAGWLKALATQPGGYVQNDVDLIQMACVHDKVASALDRWQESCQRRFDKSCKSAGLKIVMEQPFSLPYFRRNIFFRHFSSVTKARRTALNRNPASDTSISKPTDFKDCHAPARNNRSDKTNVKGNQNAEWQKGYMIGANSIKRDVRSVIDDEHAVRGQVGDDRGLASMSGSEAFWRREDSSSPRGSRQRKRRRKY